MHRSNCKERLLDDIEVNDGPEVSDLIVYESANDACHQDSVHDINQNTEFPRKEFPSSSLVGLSFSESGYINLESEPFLEDNKGLKDSNGISKSQSKSNIKCIVNNRGENEQTNAETFSQNEKDNKNMNASSDQVSVLNSNKSLDSSSEIIIVSSLKNNPISENVVGSCSHVEKEDCVEKQMSVESPIEIQSASTSTNHSTMVILPKSLPQTERRIEDSNEKLNISCSEKPSSVLLKSTCENMKRSRPRSQKSTKRSKMLLAARKHMKRRTAPKKLNSSFIEKSQSTLDSVNNITRECMNCTSQPNPSKVNNIGSVIDDHLDAFVVGKRQGICDDQYSSKVVGLDKEDIWRKSPVRKDHDYRKTMGSFQKGTSRNQHKIHETFDVESRSHVLSYSSLNELIMKQNYQDHTTSDSYIHKCDQAKVSRLHKAHQCSKFDGKTKNAC